MNNFDYDTVGIYSAALLQLIFIAGTFDNSKEQNTRQSSKNAWSHWENDYRIIIG